jgi:hypothetical protein
MASSETAFCIGSAVISAQTITIDGAAQVVPAGTYYLYDSSAGLSLLSQVEDAMTAAGIAGAAVELLGSGYVRLKSSGAVFTVAWTSTTLRDLLGFTGALAASSSYTAPLKSKLFWSPGKTELPMEAPLGIRGSKRYNVAQTFSPYTGTVESLSHGYREFNTFKWEKLNVDRIRTANELGGEYGTWFENVCVKSARWKLYHWAIENPASTTQFTYDVKLGPYVTILGSKGAEWKYGRSRSFEWTDSEADIELPVTVTPEIA